jgi:excisionase family DNA binding protein
MGVSMQQNEPWVSLEEIAVHLGVSQDTVHRWIRLKSMPAHKVGRLWKFQVSEVNAWVRAGKASEGSGSDDV